ncbi:MAG: diacylglycerol kinase family lipid kinase [Ruaniaceae bacterium]|nr:diacylglycerol kinase family lipid kinase [Ruaniaceae bacterium]
MTRLLLVVNPAAGGGRAREEAASVQQALEEEGWEVTLQFTISAEHATEILTECFPGQIVAVMAGDGVMARALKGAYDSGAIVAPIPGGRGNDLVRALGVNLDPILAARHLSKATERRIDVGWCNGRFFMGVATVGIASLANQVANETKFLRGTAVYVWGVLRALTSFSPQAFTLEVDGVARAVRAWNLSVGNGQMIGGGMRICSNAQFDDGLFDVNIIDAAPRWKVVPVLASIFDGKHVEMDEVSEVRGQVVRIEGVEPLAIMADGEYIDSLPAEFSVEPQAVRVLV